MREFNKKLETRTSVIPKKELQKLLKKFRDGGFLVEKTSIGYEVCAIAPKFEILVLRAANGENGYLCIHEKDVINFINNF